MWFKLAGADFSDNNLGTMSSISSSYLVNYKLTGMTGSPSSVSYAGSSAGTSKSTTVTISVTSGYTFKSGSTITATGGASGTLYTANSDIVGPSSFTFSLTLNGNVELSGSAVATGGSSSGGGSEGDDSTSTPGTTLPTTRKALGVTSTGTGRVSSGNTQRFSTADDTKANGILVPAGKTITIYGLHSGTYKLRMDYVYASGNVKCPVQGSTTAIEGLIGTCSNYDSSNYFPLNKSGTSDSISVTNTFGDDYYFWFGFAGPTLKEEINTDTNYASYTLTYEIA